MMTRAFRIATLGPVTVLLTSFVGVGLGQAQVQRITNGVLSGEMKSLTATVFPSSEQVLLSIPADSNFVVTQACHTTGTGTDYRLHNVGGGGSSSQATLDNTACQEFTPGLVYYGGDDVVFRNNSGSVTVRVVVNGILTKK
jgi:hypothetical protein